MSLTQEMEENQKQARKLKNNFIELKDDSFICTRKAFMAAMILEEMKMIIIPLSFQL